MRCDEALALLDDYVEGELDGAAVYQFTSHLSECEACASAHESIKREQEIYSRLLVDVEASPRLWANLRQGIELEDARHQRKSWLPSWSEFIFTAPLRIPLFAAMAVIVVMVLSFLFMRINSRQPQPGLIPDNAQLAENANAGQLAGALRQPDTPRTLLMPDSAPAGPQRAISVRRSKSNNQGRELTAARTPGESMGTWLRKLTADGEGEFIPASSFSTGTWDSDADQHAQKAEVLLVSFRNIAARRGAGLDVSYEKRQSRELIARNILLRREAQTTGDVATEELLSRLEPILIDIANLPQKTSRRDVWQIQEQMRREGIVSALRFRQTSPAVFD